MKRIAMVLVASAFVLTACGKGSTIKDFGELFDKATLGLNSAADDFKTAKDAKGVAGALTKVYDALSYFQSKASELEKKHGLTPKTPMPTELVPKKDAFQLALKNAFSKDIQDTILKYSKDPEVMAVMQKLQALQGKKA